MVDDLYKKLSEERKKLQEEGRVPEWMTTSGWQLFKEKYLYEASDFKEQAQRIAATASKHLGDYSGTYEPLFFDMIWKGWLSCSTPVLANMGTDRGMPVSCCGQYIEDSIRGFYEARLETAVLTKYGFGTSGYLGDIRPRGSHISVGGKASGVLPVIKGFIQDMRDVAQGTARRGSWAGYLPIEHGDFYETAQFVETHPDDANVGWNISDQFISQLEAGDKEAIERYQKTLKMKMVTGKGYFCFTDKINCKRPQWYVDKGLDVKASNLCNEITLHSSVDYTYTCVLSSANLSKYDEWKDTSFIQLATIFLWCVAKEFISKAEGVKGLEKAVAFTKKSMALGLGVCGLHTLFQQRGIAFEEYEAHRLNVEIFSHIDEESLKASMWLASTFGEPEWCEGYGVGVSHRIAIAPTKSTALIMGGVSEGINPDPAMVFTQATAGGEMERINPVLLDLMKLKGKFNTKCVQEIIDNNGSVQKVDWLSDKEKQVFKTAFEIDQRAILRLASTRAKYLDQWQSLNLFFSADESEAYISQVHKEAFLDENILGLYYIYSQTGVQASKDSCEACM